MRQSSREIHYLCERRMTPGWCAACGPCPPYRRKNGQAVHLGRLIPWGETVAWCCMLHAGQVRPRARRTWNGKRIA